MLNVPRSRDYQRFWAGSFAASIGLWMQQIALGWLVYDMTRSASWLGTIGLVGNLPVLVLGLVGGAIADRASRRTVMMGTQVTIALAALALAALTASGRLAIWQVIALAMVAGAASALHAPALHAAVPSLVEPGELLSAISLNSVQFNLARTLGPALAGLVYDRIGAAGCFVLNATGFLVMTVVVAGLRLPHRPAGAPAPVGRARRDGLGYARAHGVIGPALGLIAVVSLFGFPYIVLLPALARDGLGLDASGLGYLMAAVGGGAVLGGLGLSATADGAQRERIAPLSALLFGLVLAGFAVVRSVAGTALLLFAMGILQTVCVASINATIQTAVEDRMRGRIMSMLTVILFGFATVGGQLIGALGDRVGVPVALACGGGVIILAAARVRLRAPALARAAAA